MNLFRMAGGALLLPLGLGACAMNPMSVSGTSPQPVSDTYACAMQQMNRLGYEIVDANENGGFIRGRIRRGGTVGNLLTGSHQYDQITVSVYGGDVGATKLRVVAAQDQSANTEDTKTLKQEPRDETKEDVRSIIRMCGS